MKFGDAGVVLESAVSRSDDREAHGIARTGRAEDERGLTPQIAIAPHNGRAAGNCARKPLLSRGMSNLALAVLPMDVI